MNIVMVSSECLPFSKSGGLGDVAYSLTKEFAKNKHNVSVITPLYKTSYKKTKKKFNFLFRIKTVMNWRSPYGNVYYVSYEGIDYYLLENEQYFNRDRLYGYFDDGERFAYLSLAAIDILKKLPFKADIVHVHDWQTAMVPCLLKTKYYNDELLKDIKTVLTIHNPDFKGYLGRESLFDLYNLSTDLFDSGRVRLEGQVSTLKAGIAYADKITTVSPTHAEELKTLEGSKGLWYDITLRANDFSGIINGMDYKEFNPRADKIIYNKYTKTNVNTEKLKNKVEFCRENGLDSKLPLFAVVSRLTQQKGLDIMRAMGEFVATGGGNFAILGSGDFASEELFNDLVRRYPNRVYVYIGYSDELAHKLYAASDFFIMPSLFEPCGLGQMIAMRYGSLPIVRLTGGLKDTVRILNDDNSNYRKADGIGFANPDVLSGIRAVSKALIVYNSRPEYMETMRKNAMGVDHSWKKPAKAYLDLYESIIVK